MHPPLSTNGQAGHRSNPGPGIPPNGKLQPDPSSAAQGARDSHGRFAKGNPGGPGNPFARRTAALRQAFAEVATPEDLRAIAQMLLDRAKAGDLAAAKLFLAYTLGKPAPAESPDTLDLGEWELYRQSATTPRDLEQVLYNLPSGHACRLAESCLPTLAGQIANKFAQTLMPRPPKSRSKKRSAPAAEMACRNPEPPPPPVVPGERAAPPPCGGTLATCRSPAPQEDTLTPAGRAAPAAEAGDRQQTAVNGSCLPELAESQAAGGDGVDDCVRPAVQLERGNLLRGGTFQTCPTP